MSRALLADRFFTEKRPSVDFFQKWKGEGLWGPQMLPVYEWEGLLYVAMATDSPNETPSNWRILLAHPQLLAELWQSWTVPAPDAIAPVPPSPVELRPATTPAVSPTPAPAAPDLGQDPTAIFNLAESGELLEKDLKKHESESLEEHAPSEAFEALDLNPVDVPAAGLSPSAPAVSLNDLARPSGSDEALSIEVVDELSPPPEPETPVPLTAPAAAVTPSAPKAPPVPRSQEKPASPPPFAKQAPRPSQAPPAPDEWTDLFNSLGRVFEHSMILMFNEGQVIPMSWDPELRPAKADLKFSIQSASPFRIVAKTQKAYHGYLIPNEVCDAFFRNWNQGVYPAHLTMTPITSDELVKGFLMAWGPASAGTKENLQLIEAATIRITQQFLLKTEMRRSA